MMKLEDLKAAKGAKFSKKRVGRGDSSGTGGTAGRGHKGQKSRSGASTRSGFEGGQTPIYRRVPKKRGFNNIMRKEYAIINLDVLNKFDDGAEITIEVLKDQKLVDNKYKLLKVLGVGTLSKKITIKAHKISKSAQEKLTEANAKVEILQ